MSKRLLPDWITSYLEYTENTEPPQLFKLWSAIAAISSCLQRKCSLFWDEETYGNLYIILVAPSGARKGTAMTPVLNMLQHLGVPMAANAGSIQAIIKKLRKTAKTYAVPVPGATAVTKLVQHSSLTVLAPELTVFLGYDNKDLLGVLCDWYDCKSPWVYDTISRDEEPVIGMCISLFGGTTPELIQTSLPREAVGGGFVSRTIFVFGDKKSRLVAYPMRSAAERQLLLNLEHDLEEILKLEGTFTLSERFFEAWGPWYEKQVKDPPFKHPMLLHYLDRRPKHVLKLSMICSASRGDSRELDLCDLERALNILAQTEPQMPRAFIGFGKNPDADLMERVLRTIAFAKKIPLSKLLEDYRNDADYRTMENILTTLTKMRYIRIDSNGTADFIITWTGNAAQAL